MKEFMWIGDTRFVPGLGKLSKGDIREMPRLQGDSFVAQGLAEEVKPKSIKKETK